jgi:hypothetical protein
MWHTHKTDPRVIACAERLAKSTDSARLQRYAFDHKRRSVAAYPLLGAVPLALIGGILALKRKSLVAWLVLLAAAAAPVAIDPMALVFTSPLVIASLYSLMVQDRPRQKSLEKGWIPWDKVFTALLALIIFGVCIAGGFTAIGLYGLPGTEVALLRSGLLFEDIISEFNKLADALESVKDKESAKAAAVKINEIVDRLEELGKKGAWPPKTRTDEEKLLKAFEDEMEKLEPRVVRANRVAVLKCEEEPDFLKALRRLGAIGKNWYSIRKNW